MSSVINFTSTGPGVDDFDYVIEYGGADFHFDFAKELVDKIDDGDMGTRWKTTKDQDGNTVSIELDDNVFLVVDVKQSGDYQTIPQPKLKPASKIVGRIGILDVYERNFPTSIAQLRLQINGITSFNQIPSWFHEIMSAYLSEYMSNLMMGRTE